ncbi:type II secretion system protein, partial [Candidatus Obscuribacterales bacterium]|nr:type II secretion system protein [Candidatus Obscuribacterales bacterium]
MDFALIKRLTVSQRRAPRKRRSGRDARGMYIVEALVAMVISTILSFALLDMAMSAMRTMQRANSDGQAYEVIEELTEFTRAYGYERLLGYKDQTMTLVL